MHIAIIGTGSVGRALGRGWAQAGHRITYGSRTPDRDDVQALVRETGQDAAAAPPAGAAQVADAVLLAVPWSAAEAAVRSLGALDGKLLMDATNPVGPGLQHALPGGTSGAEQVAAWAKGAAVVKAFNTTGAENMADPRYAAGALAMFVCGDDKSAKTQAVRLAEALGFAGVDCGPLSRARGLEELALLWIALATEQGEGRGIGFALLRR